MTLFWDEGTIATMYEKYDVDELKELLKNRDEEIIFLKDELLKAAHQMERFAERSEEQARISSALLKLLSPTELANVPGYNISSKFVAALKGSEYMEVMNYKEKSHFGVLMTHAEGAGLSALFLACLLKFSPQMESVKKLGSFELVKQIADELQPGLKEDGKMSILYGIMNRSKNQMTICSYGNFLCLKRSNSGQIALSSEMHSEIKSDTTLKSSEYLIDLEVEESLVFLSPGFLKAFDFASQDSTYHFFSDKMKNVDWSDLNQVRNEFFILQKDRLAAKSSAYDSCVLVMQNQDRGLKLATP